MGAATPFLMAASVGMQAMGSIVQGNAASNAAKANAQIQANNAEIARRNAVLAGQKGAAKMEAEGMKNRAQIGAIRAAQAASGVDVNSPSSVDVRSSAAELGQLNAINIRSNATREAYGYKVDETSARGQSSLYRAEAKNAMTAGYMGAGSTILGGTYQGAQSGAWDDFMSSKSIGTDGIDYYNEGI